MSELHVLPKNRIGKTCNFFNQGRCKYGSSCKFIHDATATAGLQVGGRDSEHVFNLSLQYLGCVSQNLPNNKGKWIERNPHTIDSLDPQPSGTTSPRLSPRPLAKPQATQHQGKQSPSGHPPGHLKRGSIPCRSWQAGACAKGDKCYFGHDPQVRDLPTLHQQSPPLNETKYNSGPRSCDKSPGRGRGTEKNPICLCRSRANSGTRS